MFELLLALSTPNPSLLTPEPPSYSLCEAMEPDVQQGVDFGIISQEQANALLLRCLINYS